MSQPFQAPPPQPPQPPPQAPQPPQRDLELLTYQFELKGYSYRDALVPQEFAHMIQTFFVFATLLAATKAFLGPDRPLFVISSAIAVIGAFALAGFMVDIAANVSSKRAMRDAATQLERILYPPNAPPSYWHVVNTRRRFPEEIITGPILDRSAATAFVWAARLLLALWLFLSYILIVKGHGLPIPRG